MLYTERGNNLGLWSGTRQNNIPIIMLTDISPSYGVYYQFSNMQVGTGINPVMLNF